MNIVSLKGLAAALEDGVTFTADWDCGGDETIVSFYLDGNRVPKFESPPLQTLYTHLVTALELPNAGSFFVSGKGTISYADGSFSIVYEMTESGYRWDPDANREDPIGSNERSGSVVFYRSK